MTANREAGLRLRETRGPVKRARNEDVVMQTEYERMNDRSSRFIGRMQRLDEFSEIAVFRVTGVYGTQRRPRVALRTLEGQRAFTVYLTLDEARELIALITKAIDAQSSPDARRRLTHERAWAERDSAAAECRPPSRSHQ